MESTINCTMIRVEKQQLSLKLQNAEVGVDIIVTLVYEKYTQRKRLGLWESLEDMA